MRRALLLTLIAISGVACAPSTRIEKVRWHDQDAYRLSNAKAEAIVVPAWRRVMHYSTPGGKNVLWTGGEKEMKVAANAWANYGGEKAWLWPQSEWTHASGKKAEWPPPDDVASSPPARVVRVGRGWLLLSMGQTLAGGAGEVLRFYSLDEDGSLVIRSSWGSVSGNASAAARPWALWSIAQLHRPQRVVVHQTGTRAIEVLGGQPTPDIRADGTAVVDVAPATDQKLGFEANRLSAEYETFSVTMTINEQLTQGEHPRTKPAEQAQVYVAPKVTGQPDVGYVELEFTSPRTKPGELWPRLEVKLSIQPTDGGR